MAEDEGAEVLASLKNFSPSVFQSPRRSPMRQARKRARLTYGDEEIEKKPSPSTTRPTVEDFVQESEEEDSTEGEEVLSPSKLTRKCPMKVPIGAVGDHGILDKKAAMAMFGRLNNLLKLPKALRWGYFEWFYSEIDKALFGGDNDFCICYKESFPNLKTSLLRRVEWRELRRLMGKPRRCSSAFFEEERKALEEKRKKIRLLQQRKVTELSRFKDLPDEIPVLLVIGTPVTARLRSPQDGLFTGHIDAVDTFNGTYRVTFDRPDLGTHSIPDYEVQSNVIQETMPMSSFAVKERPRTVFLPSPYTPPRIAPDPAGIGNFQGNQSVFDPLLGTSPARLRLQELGQNAGGTLGGFPVKFLINVTRLSKILLVKKECIEKLQEMNTQAEKKKSYQEVLDKDFQRRYAEVVLDLERLNQDLNKYLSGVQEYCQELSPNQGVQVVDSPSGIRKKCEEDAEEIVERNNKRMGLAVKSGALLKLINSLTSLMFQVKALSEIDLNSFEFKSLSEAVSEIKNKIDPSNISCFQNNVEIHMAHIQSGLSQMGNLHAFSSSSNN